MKKMKHLILIGTLGSTLLFHGLVNAAGSAPLWYTNYLQGKTTPASAVSSQLPNATLPEQQISDLVSGVSVTLPGSLVESESTQELTAEEHQLMILLNQSRVKRGLQQVKSNHKLVELARLKAQDMAEQKYFSHTSPTYGKAIDMVRNAGINHWIVGENIAITSSASRANALFMGSSVHRATMLNRNFTEVGIGMYRAANGSLYVAEIFIGTR